MKILHCCLSNFYIDDYGYQENILPRMNVLDGHDVKILASTETYGNDKRFCYLMPSVYANRDGIEVTRLPYRKFLPFVIMKRLRYYRGTVEYLERYQPDVIFYHGNGGHGIVEVVSYVSKHPEVTLYCDSHSSFANSGKNPVSKYLLHRLINRRWIRRSLPYVEKVFCTSPHCYPFLRQMYGIPEDMMEFYPLGGIVESPERHAEIRAQERRALGFHDSDIVFLHSGKLTAAKRTSILLEAMRHVHSPEVKLVIVGSGDEEVERTVESAASEDDRIRYLGWASVEKLERVLHASDVYLQPGTPSATLQMALCSECVCAANLDGGSYDTYYDGAITPLSTIDDVVSIMGRYVLRPDDLDEDKERSFRFAKEHLDYRELARRIYA